MAEDLDLPQHVLRFWETRFSQIKPMKRGGGRRYYRPQDVDLIKGIRHMLYDQGYTIKGVQKLCARTATSSWSRLAAATAPQWRRSPSAGRPRRRRSLPPPSRGRVTTRCWSAKSKVKPSRRFFGLGKADDEGPVQPGTGKLSRDNRALLQEALLDLLECKRLLDQVR